MRVVPTDSCQCLLQEAWLSDLSEDLPRSVTTSLRYANHHYPDADSLKPTNIVCVVGNATTGKHITHREALRATNE